MSLLTPWRIAWDSRWNTVTVHYRHMGRMWSMSRRFCFENHTGHLTRIFLRAV